jgi:hypothetical protein
MARKVLLGIFLFVLVLLLFSSFQVAYADGIVSVTDPTHDLLMSASWHKARPQFYLDFIDVTEASVSLQNGVYTFEVTVVGQALPDNPAFTSKIGAPIARVHYRWVLWDSSGNKLGFMQVRLYEGVKSAAVYKRLCESRYGCGTGLPFTISSDGHTLSVAISQSDLVTYYGSQPVKWRLIAFAAFEGDTPKQLMATDGLYDYASNNQVDMPT